MKQPPILFYFKHLLSVLKCTHLWQCPEVTLFGDQMLSLTHCFNTLSKLLHFLSIFPCSCEGDSQTFLQGSSKLLINLLVDYIFHCVASSKELSLLSCKNNLFISIHNLHYWLPIWLLVIFLFSYFRELFFLIRSNKHRPLWNFKEMKSIFYVSQ